MTLTSTRRRVSGTIVDPPHAQRVAHVASRARIASAHHDPRGILRRVRVAEEDHIQPAPAEQPGRAAGQPDASGRVQHLHRDPVIRRRQRVPVAGDPLALGRCQMDHDRHQRGGEQRDQAEAEESAARLFQKRTVGSGMGQPEETRRESRSWATSRTTPARSPGSRRASSARCSRPAVRPGSR